MKLTKNYCLEMTAEEIKAFKTSIDREGGLANKILDMMLGKPIDEDDEDENEEAECDGSEKQA